MLFDPRTRAVALLTLVFEAAMYLFVFAWTPVLSATAPGVPLPLGLIFALFMVWKMTGTAVFQLWLVRFSVEALVAFMLPLAALALATPWLAPAFLPALHGCCRFELCIGIYWPSIYSLRSRYVDDDVRATAVTLFRLPMNAAVAAVLWHAGAVPMPVLLVVCCAVFWLLCGC